MTLIVVIIVLLVLFGGGGGYYGYSRGYYGARPFGGLLGFLVILRALLAVRRRGSHWALKEYPEALAGSP